MVRRLWSCKKLKEEQMDFESVGETLYYRSRRRQGNLEVYKRNTTIFCSIKNIFTYVRNTFLYNFFMS